MTITRTLGLVLTALLVVELDIVCAARLRFLDAAPTLVLLVPLLFALHGRSRGALFAIFVTCGVAAPFSAEPLPLLPLVYGGIAAVLFEVRDSLFRSHPLTEATVVALSAALASAVLEGGDLIRFGAPSIGLVFYRAAVTGVLTGALAPVAFRLLRWLPTIRGALLPAAR
ncbi:MAG: hypothetical protein HYR85_26190 [Planctomycetes bacterium]|nr:hypothetical protein [Planctomycetota bacterium]